MTAKCLANKCVLCDHGYVHGYDYQPEYVCSSSASRSSSHGRSVANTLQVTFLICCESLKRDSLSSFFLPSLLSVQSAYTMARQQYPKRKSGNGSPSGLRTASEHEEPILEFFALHRVATPYHVMRSFPHFFKYHKKVMRHLNWLAEKGYLSKHEYTGRFRSYIYNITKAGYERCRDIRKMDISKIPYQYTEPKGKQALHELQITETAVSIYEHVRKQDSKVRILDEGRFMLHNEPAFEHLVPDYWYVVSDGNGLMVRFVEMIAGEESGTRIRQMFAEYDDWKDRPEVKEFLIRTYIRHGASQPSPEFQVHCILHSRDWNHTDSWKERMAMMQTYYVSPQMQARVWTTTNDNLSNALDTGQGINAPIWRRGKDLLGPMYQQWQRVPEGRRTRFIDNCMRQLPTYPLFA